MIEVMSYAAAHPTGRVLLVIPARGGKTLVGARLVLDMAVRNGLRALWIAHREELLDEAVAHLRNVGIAPSLIGVIKSKRSSSATAPVHVASDATLERRRWPGAELIITDESHLDTAPRRRKIRKAYPNAFLVGMTATPKPPPRRDLGEDYDTLMVVVQPSELIQDGYLAAPIVFAPDKSAALDLRGVRLMAGDYVAEELEPLLLRQEILDEQVGEWARLAEGRTTVAFPVTRAHSLALVARLRAAGARAEHLDCDTPPMERKRIIAGLRSGDVQVGASVGVLSEGTNLPRVKCVLGVRPTCSLTLNIQQWTRCATPRENVRPRILDVVGNVYRHGFPSEDRHWSLVNDESGLPIGASRGCVKRCGSCGAMSPRFAASCDNCSSAFPPSTPHYPTAPIAPLLLQEVTPPPDRFADERIRLVEYAKRRGFARPEVWADEVLAKKYGGVG